MRKKIYLIPEATIVILRPNYLICVSEFSVSHDGFSNIDEEYNMFNQF